MSSLQLRQKWRRLANPPIRTSSLFRMTIPRRNIIHCLSCRRRKGTQTLSNRCRENIYLSSMRRSSPSIPPLVFIDPRKLTFRANSTVKFHMVTNQFGMKLARNKLLGSKRSSSKRTPSSACVF